jgi:hypothetical protein
MPNFLDFIERANCGPMLTEKDFNMKSLFPNVRDIVNEYEITLDRENPITSDDAMADFFWNKTFKSKESWPRGPTFDFTPEGWCLPLGNQWNNGMSEKILL